MVEHDHRREVVEMADVPDLHDPAFRADPHPTLDRWRAAGPVYRHHTGAWFLLGFDAASYGLADVRRDERNSRDPLNPFMMDGPGHTTPRRLITPSLSNRAVRSLHARAQQIVDEALAD
jgi:cytochrome P450